MRAAFERFEERQKGADDGGDLLLVASCDAVYALIPPTMVEREGTSEAESCSVISDV